MGHTRLSEERQIVDPADIQHVALVKIGTGAIRGRVVGVDERTIITIRRVINRVAVGVCRREAESSNTLAA